MSSTVLIILLFIHIVISAGVLLYPASKIRRRKEYLLPVLLVPVFGPLLALTIEILFRIDSPGTKPVELESLRLENDIYWATFAEAEEEKDVVPLEEAILINDTQIRRQAMLNTFREDSFKYLDILMVARNNDDVDTTHYATIRISKLQRQFQLKLQEYAREFERNPNNQTLLEDYIDLLETYLQSPLPEKGILQHQRSVYGMLLDKKLALNPDDKNTLLKKLRNCTDQQQDYPSTWQIVEVLKKNWPDDEQVWIEALRVCVEWKDHKGLQETIHDIQSHKIHWTKLGREQVRPWVQL